MMSHATQNIITIHILPNISRSNDNQAMKFGQLIAYNARNIFLQTYYRKRGRETSQTSFHFLKKL